MTKSFDKLMHTYQEGEFTLIPNEDGVSYWLVSNKIPGNRTQYVNRLVVDFDFSTEFSIHPAQESGIYLEEHYEQGEIVCYLKLKNRIF